MSSDTIKWDLLELFLSGGTKLQGYILLIGGTHYMRTSFYGYEIPVHLIWAMIFYASFISSWGAKKPNMTYLRIHYLARKE